MLYLPTHREYELLVLYCATYFLLYLVYTALPPILLTVLSKQIHSTKP